MTIPEVDLAAESTIFFFDFDVTQNTAEYDL